MKTCLKCQLFFQEQTMACSHCSGNLVEVSLNEALQLSEKQALSEHIRGKKDRAFSDSETQYQIRSYLKDRSLFLDFTIHKNRLKHGRRLKRFFISPISIAAPLNLPWFFFNVINTNIFHMTFTEFCPRCQCKYAEGQHSEQECEYNIEFFKIINDLLSGMFVYRKPIYEQYAKDRIQTGKRSAYQELFFRNRIWERFWDFLSVSLSVGLWIYVAVYVSYPMVKILVQQIYLADAYEFTLFILPFIK